MMDCLVGRDQIEQLLNSEQMCDFESLQNLHKFLTVYQGKIEIPAFKETAEGIGVKIGDLLQPIAPVANMSASSDHIHQQQGTIGGSGVDKLSSLKAVDAEVAVENTVVDPATEIK